MNDPPPPANPEGPTLAERIRSSPVTVALVGIDAVVFVVAEMHGGTTNNATLLRYGAVEPMHVWAGEYWRLASYMFLHIGWVHFLWNTAAGFGMCSAMERVLGRRRFLLLYLLSGIAGGAATTVIPAAVISAGASGALFGILGATIALRRRQLPSFAAAWRDKATRSTLIMIVLWTILGTQVGFNNAAHIGGLVVGALLAWIFTSPRPRPLAAAFAVGFAGLLVLATKPWMLGSARADAPMPTPFAGYDPSSPLFKRCEAQDMVACHTLELRQLEPDVALLHTVCDVGDHDACGAEGWAIAQGKGTPRDAARGAQIMADACAAGSAWSCGLAKGEPLDSN